MINNGNPHIDPDHLIKRDVGGCKVQVYFNAQRNEQAERMALDHLMLVFDRKMKGNNEDETGSLSVPRVYQAAGR